MIALHLFHRYVICTVLLAATLAVLAAPTITGFSPTLGGAGTVVTITGTNFTGVTAVKFGGTAVTAFTVSNTTTILATVGSGATGTVAVTTSGGTATSTGTFTFNAGTTPQAYGCGLNAQGECAVGYISASVNSPQPITELTSVAMITSGGHHSLALDANGNIWSWGEGTYGELGNGSTATTTTPGKSDQPHKRRQGSDRQRLEHGAGRERERLGPWGMGQSRRNGERDYL